MPDAPTLHTTAGASDDQTGVPDLEFDLVSVLYHATNEIQALAQYIADAEAAGDDDVAGFLRRVEQEDRARAVQAKTLLVQRLPTPGG